MLRSSPWVPPKISTQFAALEDVGWYGAAYSMLLKATIGQLGGSIGVPIGNAILINALQSTVPEHAPSIAARAVIAAGPLNVSTLTTSESLLQGLRRFRRRSQLHVSGSDLHQCPDGFGHEVVEHQGNQPRKRRAEAGAGGCCRKYAGSRKNMLVNNASDRPIKEVRQCAKDGKGVV
jgi:hypothetical protein